MQAQSVRESDGLRELFAQLAAEQSRPGVTQQEVAGGGAQTPAPTGPTGAAPAPATPTNEPTGTPGMTPGLAGDQQQPGDDAAGQQFNLGQDKKPVDDQQFQNSLTRFVLQKIVQWKWPERLALTKQEEMVDEKIGPDGHRNFTIVVPNIYYGGDVVSNGDFQQFIQELTQKFGIHFQGATRKGKKATLMFSTTQQEMQIDPLSDIYGKGSGSGGAGSRKAAYTMGEMLTARRNNLYETMRNIVCQQENK
jgi:hypothetical protein